MESIESEKSRDLRYEEFREQCKHNGTPEAKLLPLEARAEGRWCRFHLSPQPGVDRPIKEPKVVIAGWVQFACPRCSVARERHSARKSLGRVRQLGPAGRAQRRCLMR